MKRILLLSISAALAACGGGGRLSLSTRTGAVLTAPMAPTALALANGITVDRLRVVIREVELERASAVPDDLRDRQEYEVGPFLLDLSGAALSGTVQTITVKDVPAGAYREVKFKIHKPDSLESADPGVKEMAAQNASIIVKGTIDGQDFTFVSSVDAAQKYQGTYQVSSNANVTLNIDPSSWFGGTGAARLDPRVSSNRSQIENNIQVSMKLFQDDNRDGRDDSAGRR